MWVGSAILYILLLLPAVKSAESAGHKVMQKFGPRFGSFMGVVTTVTVVSGALLYSRYFLGIGAKWIWTTGPGMGFTVGTIAAISSYIIGTSVFGPTQGKINALGAQIAAAGKPTAEQSARMNYLQSFLMKAYQIDIVLLVVAMGAMAVARYL
jgi:hypothetical protein